MRKFLNIITSNPLSLMGTTLAATSAALIVILLVVEIGGEHGNPYVGILSFIALPAVFVTGLTLIPLGLWRDRRRQRRAVAAAGVASAFPVTMTEVFFERKTSQRRPVGVATWILPGPSATMAPSRLTGRAGMGGGICAKTGTQTHRRPIAATTQPAWKQRRTMGHLSG